MCVGRWFSIGAIALPSTILLSAAFALHSQASTQIARLEPLESAARNHFGISVATSGDLAAVGLLNDDERPTFGQMGSVVVHERVDGRWPRRASLAPPSADSWFGNVLAIDNGTILTSGTEGFYVMTREGPSWRTVKIPAGPGFASSVAIDADTAAVGVGGVVAPVVAVFVHRNGDWQQQARIQVEVGSLAMDGDRLLAGSPAEDIVRVFERRGGSWHPAGTLSPGAPSGSGRFGTAVAVGGNVVAVGAPDDGGDGTSSGAVYVFSKRAAGWVLDAKLHASDGKAGQRFGSLVDLDGDRLLVGLTGTASYHGLAYLFERIDSQWIETDKLIPADPGGGEGDHLFQSIALDGDVALLGAPWHDDIGVDDGLVDVFLLHPSYRLSCPGDVDGDGVQDLALVGSDGRAFVRDVGGDLITRFSLDARVVIDVALMPDSDSNGAAEIAILTRRPLRTEVRDLLTGGLLSRQDHDPAREPFDLELMPDRTGNGVGELAALDGTPNTVRISDGFTGQPLGRSVFSRYAFGEDLEIYPDLDGDGLAELGVLAEHSRYERSDKLEVRSVGGRLLQELWLGPRARVLRQTLVDDVDGNGYPEVAVLRAEERAPSDVVLRDLGTRQHLGIIRGERHYPPEHLLAIGDVNGNGSAELVVFARREGVGNQKVRVIDARTRRVLHAFYFDRRALAQDLTRCPDLNGNGAEEVALLGRTLDGRVKAILQDGRTGDRLAVVKF